MLNSPTDRAGPLIDSGGWYVTRDDLPVWINGFECELATGVSFMCELKYCRKTGEVRTSLLRGLKRFDIVAKHPQHDAPFGPTPRPGEPDGALGAAGRAEGAPAAGGGGGAAGGDGEAAEDRGGRGAEAAEGLKFSGFVIVTCDGLIYEETLRADPLYAWGAFHTLLPYTEDEARTRRAAGEFRAIRATLRLDEPPPELRP